MPVSLLAALDYGGYISPIKLIIFVIFFVAWIPIVNWVYTDIQAVRVKKKFWVLAIAAAGAISLLVWVLAPFFLIGLLIYIISVGAVSLAYVMHRNSLVSEFEKVLTPSHFSRMFSNEDKKIAKSTQGISFITANDNEVPLPTPKTEQAYAYQEACELFEDAVWRRATQISLVPAKQEYTVSYTIDGRNIKQSPKEREDMEYFIYLVKQIADLDTKERRKPQTGRMYSVVDGKKIAWDITTAGSTAGEKLIFKKFEDKAVMKVDDLGLEAEQVEQLKTIKERTSGLFLITAPPKDGVSTTFYAMMKVHDPFMNDINTFEKKVTSRLDNITQHVYDPNKAEAGSYDAQFQSIVRMGPSIIGVSDCEDPETAKLATNAAANLNRVVHVSFEASSTIKALAKWIKLVGNKSTVVDALIGITNQRLARKLCDECKQPYKPNPKLLKKFNIPPKKGLIFYRPGDMEYDKHGNPIPCENCQGSGYNGITAVIETIVVDDNLRALLKSSKTMKDIAMAFARARIVGIQERALKKVTSGETSINEVINELNQSSGYPQSGSKPKPKPQAKPE